MVARRCTDQITQMGDPMARWLARTIALATIALGGCEQPPDNFAPELALRTAAFAPAAPAAQAANAAGQRLAITHTFSLRLPSQDVETVQRRDLAECIKLGCTVLNTQVDALACKPMVATTRGGGVSPSLLIVPGVAGTPCITPARSVVIAQRVPSWLAGRRRHGTVTP